MSDIDVEGFQKWRVSVDGKISYWNKQTGKWESQPPSKQQTLTEGAVFGASDVQSSGLAHFFSEKVTCPQVGVGLLPTSPAPTVKSSVIGDRT